MGKRMPPGSAPHLTALHGLGTAYRNQMQLPLGYQQQTFPACVLGAAARAPTLRPGPLASITCGCIWVGSSCTLHLTTGSSHRQQPYQAQQAVRQQQLVAFIQPLPAA